MELNDYINLSCFTEQPQNFLFCVTIHKARNLKVLNADTFVVVSFDYASRRTETYQNSDCPFFNEYFVFELNMSLKKLLTQNVILTIYRRTCCARKNIPIGELIVNLSMIWGQPGHLFYKKWGVLESPKKTRGSNETMGYLQVDLTIVAKDEQPPPGIIQARDYDVIENNLLEPVNMDFGSVKVKYCVKIYHGFLREETEAAIHVLFAGIVGKTKFSKLINSPVWNEQIEITWCYPSLINTMILELHEDNLCAAAVISRFDIPLSAITQNFTNLPSLGPTYINFYDVLDEKHYIGRVLIKISAEAVEETAIIMRRPIQTSIMSINESEYWNNVKFHIKLAILDLYFAKVDKRKLKVKFKCGDLKSTEMDFTLNEYPNSHRKYSNISANSIPVMSLDIVLPDNRIKFETNTKFRKLHKHLKNYLECFSLRRYKVDSNTSRQYLQTVLKEFSVSLQEMLPNLYYKVINELSEWDQNQMKFKVHLVEMIMEEVKKCTTQLNKSSTTDLDNWINAIEEKLQEMLGKLNAINSNVISDKWPDIWIFIYNGSQVLAAYKADPKHYLYHFTEDFTAELCLVPNSVVFKPIHCNHSCQCCGCIVAVAKIYIWIGPILEKDDSFPSDFHQISDSRIACTTLTTYRLRAYINQAKIRPGGDSSGLCDGKLAVYFNNLKSETGAIEQSLSPVWNKTIEFDGIKLPTNSPALEENPPFVMLELLDEDGSQNVEILCAAHCQPTIIYRPDMNNKTAFTLPPCNTSPPHLKWVSLSKNGRMIAEVLISIELRQIDEEMSEILSTLSDIPPQIHPPLAMFQIDVVFVGIRDAIKFPLNTIGRYKIEINFGELSLKSGPSGPKHEHSFNFLDPFVSDVVKLPASFIYWPPMVIKNLECTQKEQVVGAAMIPNLKKWFINENTIPAKVHFNDVQMGDTGEMEAIVAEVHEHNETDRLIEDLKVNKKQNAGSKNKFRSLFRRNKTSDTAGGDKMDQQAKRKFDELYNWWTKFYNSEKNYQLIHSLVIYNSELENQPQFESFQDWAMPIVFRTKVNTNTWITDSAPCTLKARLRIRNVIESSSSRKKHSNKISKHHFENISHYTAITPITVRVYVVQGQNLRSLDKSGNSDSYLMLKFANQKQSTREMYVPNQCNPVYGHLFQVTGVIPRDQYLKLSVYDYDGCTDDLIGETVIDIEDRLRSRYRAHCGIAKEYNRGGYNIWRDIEKPSEILKHICYKHGVPLPKMVGKKMQVDDVTFEDESAVTQDNDILERLSLTVLNNLDKLPSIGFQLVPEHVEARSLYHKKYPGIEQGKLLMWIEIFSPDKVSAPLDLTPQIPGHFELRVIVWNTTDVVMNEKNLFGTKMSDIYVLCWLADNTLSQQTDIHFRSLNGTGNFNWRMIFPFRYSRTEDVMILTKPKSIFEKIETEVKVPATLHVQIWDNDSLSSDDFLGSTTITLSHFVTPTQNAAQCVLPPSINATKKTNSTEKQKTSYENLFYEETIKGWFPCQGYDKKGKLSQTGKIEMELQIVTVEEAEVNPMGFGRDPPNALPPPNRPETSFNWFTNPWKALKYILGPKIKQCCKYCGLTLLVIVIIGCLVMAAPKILENSLAHFAE